MEENFGFVNKLGGIPNGMISNFLCNNYAFSFFKAVKGYSCDIETWLLFLCMMDDDVQANDLSIMIIA